MRDDGRVVLLDFGIAKPTGGDGLNNLTGAGVVMGTPSYLSPEQARGRTLDARTDQFSLAVTAHELLTRSIPWSATSAIEIVAAIMNETPPALKLADVALADAVRPVLRAARRAWARGDKGRARALAKRVVDAWKLVDMKVPTVAEMTGLLSAP